MNKKNSAIFYMIFSSLCVTVICALGKCMSENFSLPLLVFIRFFFPFIMITWVNFTNETPYSFRVPSQQLLPHFKRAVFVLGSQYAIFYYLLHHSALEGTALLSTAPLFIPLLNHYIDGTPMNKEIGLSIALGFTGVLLMIKPDPGAFLEWSAVIGLSAGLFNACSQRCLHRVAKKDPPIRISLLLYGLTSLLAAIPLTLSWHTIYHTGQLHYVWDSDLLIIFLLFSVASISNQVCRSRAYSQCKTLGLLTPIGYSTLLFSSIFDFLNYGLLPDIYAIIGAVCITLGGVASIYFSKKPSVTHEMLSPEKA